MDPLRLAITDYQDDTHWRWCLSDGAGRFLADHQVQLDPGARESRGLRDLRDDLDYYTPAYPPDEQLKDLGVWIGEAIFGGLKDALHQQALKPATPIRVEVPPEARALLHRPFDLARLAGRDGPSLGELGLSLVYCPAGLPDGSRAKDQTGEALRVLACFSLPDNANPLNLRRERYGLKRLVQALAQTRGRSVTLRVIQYGATRDTLKDALQEAPGWDLIHLSGHGGAGELLLETPAGGMDRIGAGELAGLLAPARGRVKLLILAACYSGAASHMAARARLGLDLTPARDGAEPGQTGLPSLAEDLARALDCAALAMRYPVDDSFATDLSLALYDQLLAHRQPLPAALRLALDAALAADPAARGPADLSPYTPVLLGPRAAGLTLVPPARPPGGFVLPQTGLHAFPAEPPRFVGRVGPMLRASLALAPESPYRAVLFHGMAGAGKTACALELAYRHEQDRFAGQVWYQGPEDGRSGPHSMT
ncbi:CHAT domain-containing protein [uncultured Thiodictyon sp.]|uniref:CHAT domain-containing protein n=1 Tax=uncultured Thiodictyon sp. TaxID=1846217 RepID=UPI0025DAC912|nr:CHAT domain-containing protein [uncultured Thiodictyon sp.]